MNKTILLILLSLSLCSCKTLDYWYSVYFVTPKNPFENKEQKQ